MAESSMNGVHNIDVEMKEEGTEQAANPVQAAPPYQPDQSDQQAAMPSIQATSNGYPSQLDGTMAPLAYEPPRAQVAQPSMEQANAGAAQQFVGQSQVAQEPAAQPSFAQTSSAAPLPASNPPHARLQAPLSAPTPPAVRESSRTSSLPPAGVAPPERPNAHGAPTRVYLNQNITPHLLEGMKYLAAYEPEKPLKWLSDFLAKRSAEIEGDS